jgi:dTDP-4-dehydrorhamnose 3,5-epimerase
VIEGLRRIPLTVRVDHRGAILPMLRADQPHFERFGEIYFSLVHRGQVKGWNLHRRVTCNLAVVAGRVRFLFVDGRTESASRGDSEEQLLSRDDYALLVVPSGLWISFRAEGSEDGLVANCATEPHDPAEVERRPLDDPAMPRWSAP